MEITVAGEFGEFGEFRRGILLGLTGVNEEA